MIIHFTHFFVIYCVVSSTDAIETSLPKCCPSGWSMVPKGTKCLYFSSKQLSWFDAARFCKKFDAQLASVHSDRESETIKRLTPNELLNTGIWLGGVTTNPAYGAKQDWYWFDLTPFSYDNFGNDEPSNSKSCEGRGLPDTSQSCLQICNIHKFGMNWDDECCSAKLPFICEKRPSLYDCTGGK
uniref:C-type lectin domain-containing protein n=1 Tax=Plectus sambesii TaxID=2011161 RepID=A0A914X2Y3_9BILA